MVATDRDECRRSRALDVPSASHDPSAMQKKDGPPEAPQNPLGLLGDGRLPSSAMRSYALLKPEIKAIYMQFYKATYGKSILDDKTKEFVAIAASLALGCKGCTEGHLKKAKKDGATQDEISEVIAITLGVAAAAIVDRSDIANFHLGGLFDQKD